jgi:hypothetical protein
MSRADPKSKAVSCVGDLVKLHGVVVLAGRGRGSKRNADNEVDVERNADVAPDVV